MAIVDVLYARFAPKKERDEQLINNTSSLEKFKWVYRHCMALLQKLDEIPPNILQKCEQYVRNKRRIDFELSKKAIVQQNRFEMWTKQIKHQFEPAAEFKRIALLSKTGGSSN